VAQAPSPVAFLSPAEGGWATFSTAPLSLLMSVPTYPSTYPTYIGRHGSEVHARRSRSYRPREKVPGLGLDDASVEVENDHRVRGIIEDDCRQLPQGERRVVVSVFADGDEFGEAALAGGERGADGDGLGARTVSASLDVDPDIDAAGGTQDRGADRVPSGR